MSDRLTSPLPLRDWAWEVIKDRNPPLSPQPQLLLLCIAERLKKTGDPEAVAVFWGSWNTVADWMGRPRRTIYDWREKLRLAELLLPTEAIHLGGVQVGRGRAERVSWRLFPDDVDAWLEEHGLWRGRAVHRSAEVVQLRSRSAP